MTETFATTTSAPPVTTPGLGGQTVVVVGGSSGIGLETARQAHAAGAEVILTGRSEDRLEYAAADVGALRTAAFDVTDSGRLDQFFADLPAPIDHVMVSGAGPYYAPLEQIDLDLARREVEQRLLVPLQVARLAVGRVRAGGSLVFIGATGARRAAVGRSIVGALTAALTALTRNLALEIAPIRVNLVAPGFVDSPLTERLLGDQLDAQRERLRTTLPIRRVVGLADVAAVAVHLMVNTALTGATYDVDGGQQLLPA